MNWQHGMKKYLMPCALWLAAACAHAGMGLATMLSSLPPLRPGSIEEELLGDPPDFDRSQLPDVDHKITAFFRKHLLP